MVSALMRAAMLDHVDTELGATPDAGVEGRMGGQGQAVAMRLVDDRRQLLVGELERVVAGHDLDEIGAAAHLLAHGAAHLVGAARLAAAPVGVPTGLDDRLRRRPAAADPGKMPCATACLANRLVLFMPRSRKVVTPARRLISMLPAHL